MLFTEDNVGYLVPCEILYRGSVERLIRRVNDPEQLQARASARTIPLEILCGP